VRCVRTRRRRQSCRSHLLLHIVFWLILFLAITPIFFSQERRCNLQKHTQMILCYYSLIIHIIMFSVPLVSLTPVLPYYLNLAHRGFTVRGISQERKPSSGESLLYCPCCCRSEAETQYAKSLSKLSGKLLKASKDSVGTVHQAWQRAGAQMEAQSEIHR